MRLGSPEVSVGVASQSGVDIGVAWAPALTSTHLHAATLPSRITLPSSNATSHRTNFTPSNSRDPQLLICNTLPVRASESPEIQFNKKKHGILVRLCPTPGPGGSHPADPAVRQLGTLGSVQSELHSSFNSNSIPILLLPSDSPRHECSLVMLPRPSHPPTLLCP